MYLFRNGFLCDPLVIHLKSFIHVLYMMVYMDHLPTTALYGLFIHVRIQRYSVVTVWTTTT